jgi:hypothetical protein
VNFLSVTKKLKIDIYDNESPKSLYLDSTYFIHNPDWYREDNPRKASLVKTILNQFKLEPSSIYEVGRVVREILMNLKKAYLNAVLTGHDISPDVAF